MFLFIHMLTPENIIKLQEVMPFRFRVWSWLSKDKNNKPTKYRVVAYVDARDVMDRLDAIVTPIGRKRQHAEIKWNLFCWVSMLTKDGWVTKRDNGTESKIEKEKWESSDSFKRACVNWWLGRFLYSVPSFIITKEEANKNMYNMTNYVRQKFKTQLTERYDNNEIKVEFMQSKYTEQVQDAEEPQDIDDVDMEWFEDPLSSKENDND